MKDAGGRKKDSGAKEKGARRRLGCSSKHYAAFSSFSISSLPISLSRFGCTSERLPRKLSAIFWPAFLTSSAMLRPASFTLPKVFCILPSTCLPAPLASCSSLPVTSPNFSCALPAKSFIFPVTRSLSMFTPPFNFFDLNCCSASSYQLENQCHNGQNQQQVNEPPKCVAAHDTDQPKNQQNHENRPKHSRTSQTVTLTPQ